MKLIQDWRKKLNALWSVRLAILTALLAVADQLIAPLERIVPAWAYALLSIGIIVARVIYQPAANTATAIYFDGPSVAQGTNGAPAKVP